MRKLRRFCNALKGDISALWAASYRRDRRNTAGVMACGAVSVGTNQTSREEGGLGGRPTARKAAWLLINEVDIVGRDPKALSWRRERYRQRDIGERSDHYFGERSNRRHWRQCWRRHGCWRISIFY